MLSIVIVNYNSSLLLCELLQSLTKSAFQHFEVIVVDNASPNDDLSSLKHQEFLDIQLIESKVNLGFAGANNLGIRAAKGDYYLLLNPDTLVEPDTLGTLMQSINQSEEIAVVSPKIKYHHSPELIQYAGTQNMNPITLQAKPIGKLEKDQGQHDQSRVTAYAHGAAMLLRKSAVETVGLMQEDYFLYYEELDWCQRIRKAGFKIYYEANALVWHKESHSVGKNSPLKTYYLNRNRILFGRRHFQWYQLCLAFCYLICFSIPKQLWTRRKDKEDRAAYLKALSWHFKNLKIQKKQQLQIALH